MDTVAKYTVAQNSKEQAQFYRGIGNYGRAFAHYLVALKLIPHWKNELKAHFTSTLCNWGEQLETQQRFTDLFNCYEQATEIFPENEEVFSNLGAHLFRLGHLCEAAHYFRKALEIHKDYLPAYRNLQSVCNSLLERWHFRMLNDSHRNQAYKEAIMKKIRQGFTSVLDIGTGTGILSLFAVAGGAKDVHACDYSPTMCRIAAQVFQANNVEGKVVLLNKLSNDLTIPDDLPCRISLVVTETMDAGLLGEHLLQTLTHAWDTLLRPACPQLVAQLEQQTALPRHGVVVPLGARLWATPIRCPDMARRSFTNLHHLCLYSNTAEPYDTENLRNFLDCQFLCDPVQVFSFDFNNPSELKAYLNGEKDGKCVSFQFEGQSDALTLWFDVLLDEDITISSSPFSEEENCCWDQAVFKFKKPLNSVEVRASCGGGRLRFDPVLRSSAGVNNNVNELPVCEEVISFLNNKELQESILNLAENSSSVKTVLDLAPFPMLGVRFLQLNNANVTCVVKSGQEKAAVNEFVKTSSLNGINIKCVVKNGSDKSELYSSIGTCQKFDMIFVDLFDSTGELKDDSINRISQLQEMLSPGGVFVPAVLTAFCQLIDCEWISRTSRVIDEDLTQTFKIAEFINVYQVSQQLDVDLRHTKYTALSKAQQCLQLTVSELATDARVTKDLPVRITASGQLTGVSLWYEYQLTQDTLPLSTLAEQSHVRQIVCVVDPPLLVKCGDILPVNFAYQQGITRITVVK